MFLKEYAPIPIEGRSRESVKLIEDLVIGTDLSNEAALLYQPSSVVASAEGDIFVGDSGANDIKVFSSDGTYLRTLRQAACSGAAHGRGRGDLPAVRDTICAQQTSEQPRPGRHAAKPYVYGLRTNDLDESEVVR